MMIVLYVVHPTIAWWVVFLCTFQSTGNLQWNTEKGSRRFKRSLTPSSGDLCIWIYVTIPVLGPLFIVYRRGYYLWTVFVWWFLHVSFRLFSSIIQGILGYTMKRMLLGNLQRNTWHNQGFSMGILQILQNLFQKIVRNNHVRKKFCFKNNIPQKNKKDYKKNKLSQVYIHLLGGGFKCFLFSPLLGEDFQFD